MHAIVWMAAALPVVVGQLSTGPQAHMTVTNTASQPVSAWAFAVVTHPEAGRTQPVDRRQVWWRPTWRCSTVSIDTGQLRSARATARVG